jgi:hypothetical protein
LEKFKVHNTTVYTQITKDIKDPTLLPVFPPRRGVDKANWHTVCTKIKLTRMSETGMVNTFLYHR